MPNVSLAIACRHGAGVQLPYQPRVPCASEGESSGGPVWLRLFARLTRGRLEYVFYDSAQPHDCVYFIFAALVTDSCIKIIHQIAWPSVSYESRILAVFVSYFLINASAESPPEAII